MGSGSDRTGRVAGCFFSRIKDCALRGVKNHRSMPTTSEDVKKSIHPARGWHVYRNVRYRDQHPAKGAMWLSRDWLIRSDWRISLNEWHTLHPWRGEWIFFKSSSVVGLLITFYFESLPQFQLISLFRYHRSPNLVSEFFRQNKPCIQIQPRRRLKRSLSQ